MALILPTVARGLPAGLAPTTSTTVMLALGDALAVALLERKGFSADDFQVLHPGGKLGRGLLRVSEIMHTGDEVPLLGVQIGIPEAILDHDRQEFGCVGIDRRDGKLAESSPTATCGGTSRSGSARRPGRTS